MATLCSINVNGMAELSKRQRVFHSLLSLNYDIYALQEMHLSSLDLGKTWEKEWGGGGARFVVARHKSIIGNSPAF